MLILIVPNRWLRWLALFLIIVPSAHAVDLSRRFIDRAITIRNVEDILYNVDSARDVLFTYCQELHGTNDPGMDGQLRNPVSRIFLASRNFLGVQGESCNMLRRFIAEAHVRNIPVEYLDGDRSWIEGGSMEASRVMYDYITFNRGGAPDEQFDGFLFDVRPEGWAMAYTKETCMAVNSLLHLFRTSGPPRLRLGIALPRWYFSRIGRDAFVEVMKQVNTMVIDDYVHQESVLIQSMEDEALVADSMGVSLYAGINAEANMNPSMSYSNEGWLQMEKSISALCSTYAGRQTFQGVIINDYQSYRDLKRSRHSMGNLSSWSKQSQRSFADCLHDSVDVVVLDPITDTLHLPKQKMMDSVKQFISPRRQLLMTIAMKDIADFDASKHTWKKLTTAEMIKRFSKVFDAGCNGFLVECGNADSVGVIAGVSETSSAIVDALDSLGTAFREKHSMPSTVIVLHSCGAFLPEMNSAHFGRLSGIVDGILVDIPGPLHVRERDTVFARLWPH